MILRRYSMTGLENMETTVMLWCVMIATETRSQNVLISEVHYTIAQSLLSAFLLHTSSIIYEFLITLQAVVCAGRIIPYACKV